MRFTGSRFKVADSFQQMIGGILLAGPFVVEGGVWEMAATMQSYQAGFLAFLVLLIGWAALYKADKDRNIQKEVKIFKIPVRYLSLITVSYLAVVFLVIILAGQATYQASLIQTAKLVSIASVFSVIGAATADSVF